MESMFVGGSSRKIKKLFREAKKQTPAIIFIDEIDSIAGKREMEMASSDCKYSNKYYSHFV